MSKLITELGYIGLEVSDLDAWERHATEVLGMTAATSAWADTRYLRMDDRAARIILTQGPSNDIAFAGWQSPNTETLRAFAAHLEAQRVEFHWATDNELASRQVDAMLHFTDPIGLRHEAYCGPALAVDGYVSPRIRSGFVTGAGGLGHLVLAHPQADAEVAFMQRTVGLAMSDHIRQQMAPGFRMDVAFMHVNERHHSFAVAKVPARGPKLLHHCMVEVGSVEDVGRVRDRCLAAGLVVEQDIGQHSNDKMISFYGQTPAGFLIEFGCGGVKVDDATWQVVTYDRFSEWGHRPAAAPQGLPSGAGA